jgi:streptomycin 6-kinase
MLSKRDLVEPSVLDRWESRYGRASSEWVENSWQKLQSLIDQWGLCSLDKLRGGSESIVVAAKQDELDVVVKFSPPWRLFPDSEVAALRAWDGNGAPRLIRVDGNVILMERIFPGGSSKGKDLEEIASLIRSLSVSVRPKNLPKLSSAVAARFERARENRHDLVSPKEIDLAASAAISIANNSTGLESVGIVHGDLLSKNILLSADKDLVAIDPLASWGDRTFDVALWSVTEEPVCDAHERAKALARSLDFDVNRVLEWIPWLLTAEACLSSYSRANQSAEAFRSKKYMRDCLP